MLSTIFKNKKPLLIFLIPAFVFMSFFLYYPFVMNIVNSVHHIDGLGTAGSGLNQPWYENFVRIFTDPDMRTAFRNSLILMVCTVVFQVGIAVILALLVDNISRGAQFYRTVYFFPIVISATALGLMFNLIFLYKGGMVNTLLLKIHPGANPIDWKDEKHWLFTMLLPQIWQYIGYYFVILTTGLTNISNDIYEAAKIDGATGFQKVRYISLPLLHNTLCTCITLAITGSLKCFDMPWTMFPNGMPLDKSWILGTYMYKTTFNASDVDYGSAIALVIVVLGVIMAQVARHVFKEKDY